MHHFYQTNDMSVGAKFRGGFCALFALAAGARAAYGLLRCFSTQALCQAFGCCLTLLNCKSPRPFHMPLCVCSCEAGSWCRYVFWESMWAAADLLAHSFNELCTSALVQVPQRQLDDRWGWLQLWQRPGFCQLSITLQQLHLQSLFLCRLSSNGHHYHTRWQTGGV